MPEQFTPGTPLILNLPQVVRSLDFTFYLRPLSGETKDKNITMSTPYATLYMKMSYSPNIPAQELRTRSYPISSYNFADIRKLFNDANSWFDQEVKEQLWGTTNQGQLVFNMDYKDLKLTHVDEFSGVKTALKISPTTAEIGQNIYVPGVALSINKLSNTLILTEDEVSRLADFFNRFDFTVYTSFLINCYIFCKVNGSILTKEEAAKRYSIQRSYDSNLI